MRRNILITVLVLAGLLSCAKPDGFVIKGIIQGRDNGEITLLRYSDGKYITEDSAKILQGKFELKGKTDLPEMRIISLGPQQVVAQFFAENGAIYVKINTDSVNMAGIKGSKSNEEFSILTREIMNNSRETQVIQNKFMEAQQKRDEQGVKQAQADYQAMIENQKVYVKNFIHENRKSTVSPFAALMQFSQEMTAHEIDTLINFFDPSIQKSIYIAELKKIADRLRITEIGATAPDFTLNTPEGTALSLSSLKGKIVLIDFWASWCKPCRLENPNVVLLYNQYKDKGFDILGISLDKEKGAWVKAIADDKLTWHHVSDLKFWQSDVAVKYGVQAIPFTLLLDKEGKIIGKNIRGEALGKKLRELFGQ